MEPKLIQTLIKKAKGARRYSQAKYSNFRVGAALLCDGNTIVTGSNVESSSYGLSICAERVALTKALSDGKNGFLAIAISGKDNVFCSPCGACRQLLMDYAPNLQVILTDGEKYKVYSLKELLPEAFDDSQLEQL